MTTTKVILPALLLISLSACGGSSSGEPSSNSPQGSSNTKKETNTLHKPEKGKIIFTVGAMTLGERLGFGKGCHVDFFYINGLDNDVSVQITRFQSITNPKSAYSSGRTSKRTVAAGESKLNPSFLSGDTCEENVEIQIEALSCTVKNEQKSDCSNDFIFKGGKTMNITDHRK